MPKYIFDLDGTLTLIEHRRHFVQKGLKQWDAFYAACVHDEPNHPVIQIAQLLAKLGEIYILSGRSAVVRTETIEWLKKHDVPFYRLFMRKADDYTPDEILKARWLDEIENEGGEIISIFDDRDKVVKMWRDRGYPCFQVAAGEF